MKCAYCEYEGKLTREHIIPKGFINHMDDERQITYSEKAPIRIINSEIQIKDVCASCNNGELSKLDSYALNLILNLKQKNLISPITKKIYFKYNYNLLERWLLKICYNTARANDSNFDSSLYKKNIDYIMNNGSASSNIAVYAIFTGYDKMNEDFINNLYQFDKNSKYDIDWFRIGVFRLKEKPIFNSAMRFISINYITFMIIVSENAEEFSSVKEIISSKHTELNELLGSGKVCLKRDMHFYYDTLIANVELKENFMSKRIKDDVPEMNILQLEKDDIVYQDYSKINWLIDSYMKNKDILKDYYQKIYISVDGYDNELRELYQIPEYQNYVKKLFDNVPEIIWLLNMENNNYNPIKSMIWAYINDNIIYDINDDSKKVEPNKEQIIKLTKIFFEAINGYTHKYAFDQSVNNSLTLLLKEIIFTCSEIVQKSNL